MSDSPRPVQCMPAASTVLSLPAGVSAVRRLSAVLCRSAARGIVLAPLALAVVLLYSYMKRITRWSHLVLGLALGIAPSAAWIAVRGECAE